MEDIDLKEIEKKKYSPWCQIKPLICTSKDRKQRADAVSSRNDLSPLVKSAIYFHELTGCNGLEFTAISNIKFNDFMVLPNNAILVPWFLPDVRGKPPNDPFVALTLQMQRESRFGYDGWIEIDNWDEENVAKIIQSIPESLSIFSVIFDLYISWQPKYWGGINLAKPYHELNTESISSHHKVFHQISTISETDKRAIYRSFSWLSQAKQMDSPPARFLFYILSIEALAKYIEDASNDDSCFASLRSNKMTKKERREVRDKCIKEQMKNYENDPSKTISDAYFNCVVGIKETLKRHLEFVLPNDSERIKMLFEEKIDGKSLYELRHDIAHGTLDLLTENQVNRIIKRLGEAEQISNRYILTVLKKSLGIEFPNTIQSAIVFTALNSLQYNPKSD